MWANERSIAWAHIFGVRNTIRVDLQADFAICRHTNSLCVLGFVPRFFFFSVFVYCLGFGVFVDAMYVDWTWLWAKTSTKTNFDDVFDMNATEGIHF